MIMMMTSRDRDRDRRTTTTTSTSTTKMEMGNTELWRDGLNKRQMGWPVEKYKHTTIHQGERVLANILSGWFSVVADGLIRLTALRSTNGMNVSKS